MADLYDSSVIISTQGTVAHDAVDADNPVKVGMKAIALGANPTAVAAGDRSDLYCNRHGVPFQIGGHPNILNVSNNYTTAQTNTVIITIASGRIVVTKVSVYLSKAASVNANVNLDWSGGGGFIRHPAIAPGSGFVEGNGAGILGISPADGEDLRFSCEVPTGGSIQVNVSYFTIEG